MTKRRKIDSKTPQPERILGEFRLGELIPLKGCWLRVAHVEAGVLVLALDSYTKRGQEVISELRAQMLTKRGQNGPKESDKYPTPANPASNNPIPDPFDPLESGSEPFSEAY